MGSKNVNVVLGKHSRKILVLIRARVGGQTINILEGKSETRFFVCDTISPGSIDVPALTLSSGVSVRAPPRMPRMPGVALRPKFSLQRCRLQRWWFPPVLDEGNGWVSCV